MPRFVGLPELLILAPVVVVVVAIVLFFAGIRRRAQTFGYSSTRAYLRAAPRSDAEKRDAADLALRGVVLFALAILFSPFVLAALVPLFYGGRKIVFALLGLGLVDDPDVPGA